MKHPRLRIGILSSLLFLSPGPLHAQDEEPPLVLPEIVVTPLRMPVTIERAPYASTSLSLREPGASALARNLPETLTQVPSVLVQKTAHGQGSPFVRGFTGFRALWLVDGIRLNNSVFRDGPNQYLATVDPGSIERLEVVGGPASVLYGSDAIGGAVNALPVRPPMGEDAAPWGGRTIYRYASAEDSHGGRLELSGYAADAHLGWIGGVSARSFGDLRGGRHVERQPKTGYDEWAGDLRVEWQAEADTRLTLAHQSMRQDDVWRTHRTIYGITWKGLEHGDELEHVFDQARDLTYIRWEKERPDGGDMVTIYRHGQFEDLRRVTADGSRRTQGFDLVAWGVAAQTTRESDFGLWTLGADYQADLVDSYGRRYDAEGRLKKIEIQGPVADDASYHLAGVYLQNRFSPKAAEGLDIVSGARYTFARADADRVQDPVGGGARSLSDEWHNVVGSLRAVQSLGAGGRSSLYAGVSQGFRAPNLSDLTRLDVARSGELETPSPDLDPEQFVSAEIGARFDATPLRLELAAYRTWIDDMIVRAPTGRTLDNGLIEVVKKNAGDGFIHGVECRAELRLAAEWSAWTTVGWLDGEVDGYPESVAEKRREPISRLPPTTVRAGLTWSRENGQRWFEIAGEAAEKADRLSASDQRDTQRIPPGGTPGYAVLHLRGGARLTEALSLVAALENVFDTDYRIHGSGVNEPGRNFVISAEWMF
jgi:hemoglobin/transferrin/lactoferrin receptor protein